MTHPDTPRPELPDGFTALILNTDGTVDMMNHRFVPVRVHTPQAIGSGGDYAIGAMRAGVSPEQAVQIAAECDMWTGGKTVVMHL